MRAINLFEHISSVNNLVVADVMEHIQKIKPVVYS